MIKTMTLNDIRSKYLEFFKARGHTIVPSASLVPEGDSTTLFTGSGMQPMVPYLLGKSHPAGTRIADSQKSLRAEDIEEVGDNRHTTFFEMLGNWSFGDYFKKEQLAWCFEFLTDVVKLDSSRLYVSVFIGDEQNALPQDTESAALWKTLFAKKGIDAHEVMLGSAEDGSRLGMQGGLSTGRQGRIFYYDAKKNWWSRAGAPPSMPDGEIGGPDSEVFYDFGTPHDSKYGAECHPNCDCGRFLEICNSVFMQYVKKNGMFIPLPNQNVDFGGGLERLAAASNNDADIFRTDVFAESVQLLEYVSGKSYNDSRYTRSFRIVADHVRAAVFMLGDGVRPSNTERGYIVRRLIRRAALHALKLDAADKDKEDGAVVRVAKLFIEKYRGAYGELGGDEAHTRITGALWDEEKLFARTLSRGMREFEKIVTLKHVSGEDAFTLTTTYGFPFEMIVEIANERGMSVDETDFKKRMEMHQALSRAGAEQKFKGGLADTSEKTTRLHTAHHLLLRALQIVLGSHVKQRGSNITQERLRIDFSHGMKMTTEQIREVERIVNEKIKEKIPVVRTEMAREDAERLGAEQEFGVKYAERVSVYSVGPIESAFSLEFCGGPHVTNTKELGIFKIKKEEAVAAGVRRIKGVLE
ncbi:MAG TPA: alanine--tRNA ligase-related protein [Candidatus Paceibacterota bacterium]